MTFFRTLIIAVMVFWLSGCEETDVGMLASAGIDVVSAVTLTDQQVANLAHRVAVTSDSQHRVAAADNPYAVRLRRITKKHKSRGGLRYNFKAYLTMEVNAFALADGSIRVYSGLMDLMDDDELLFVIGHEMGHVAKKHSRKKVIVAYASSAVRKGIASQENTIGQLARSVLGSLTEQLANAQFSQHEERQADDYGTTFLEEQGYSRDSAVSALNKLALLASQHTLLSSHPEPAARSRRIATGEEEEKDSIVQQAFNTVQNLFWHLYTFIKNLIA